MTPQTIAHAQRHLLRQDIHGLYFTVTCLTENAGNYVWSVVEVDVIRQGVNPFPFQRLSGGVERGKLRYRRGLRLGDLVTIHALFDGRYPSLSRLQSTGMAVQTRNPENTGVKLV